MLTVPVTSFPATINALPVGLWSVGTNANPRAHCRGRLDPHRSPGCGGTAGTRGWPGRRCRHHHPTDPLQRDERKRSAIDVADDDGFGFGALVVTAVVEGVVRVVGVEMVWVGRWGKALDGVAAVQTRPTSRFRCRIELGAALLEGLRGGGDLVVGVA